MPGGRKTLVYEKEENSARSVNSVNSGKHILPSGIAFDLISMLITNSVLRERENESVSACAVACVLSKLLWMGEIFCLFVGR